MVDTEETRSSKPSSDKTRSYVLAFVFFSMISTLMIAGLLRPRGPTDINDAVNKTLHTSPHSIFAAFRSKLVSVVGGSSGFVCAFSLGKVDSSPDLAKLAVLVSLFDATVTYVVGFLTSVYDLVDKFPGPGVFVFVTVVVSVIARFLIGLALIGKLQLQASVKSFFKSQPLVVWLLVVEGIVLMAGLGVVFCTYGISMPTAAVRWMVISFGLPIATATMLAVLHGVFLEIENINKKKAKNLFNCGAAALTLLIFSSLVQVDHPSYYPAYPADMLLVLSLGSIFCMVAVAEFLVGLCLLSCNIRILPPKRRQSPTQTPPAV